MSAPTAPGMYWARIDGEWEVVRLDDSPQKAPAGSTWTDSIGWDAGQLVPDDCWGPKVEPPMAAPVVPSGAHALLHYLARGIEDTDREIAKLTTRRTALAAELYVKLAERAARGALDESIRATLEAIGS